jgi:phospholipase C
MRKIFFAAALAATSLLVACSGGSTATNTSSFVPAGTPTPSQTTGPIALAAPVSGSPILHVIVVIQENRTLDNLFGQSVYNQTGATTFGPYPGANAADTWSVGGAPSSALSQVPFEYPYDPSHVHAALESEFSTPQNLGFALDQSFPAEAGLPAAPAGFEGANIPAVETTLYHTLALTYGLADDFFSSRLVPTFPGHLYLISGQSQAADDPLNPGQTTTTGSNPVDWGCDSTPGSLVPVFTGVGDAESTVQSGVFPCFNQQTIGDLMDAKGVTWKYYTGSLSNTVDAGTNVYDAIQHIRSGADWTNDVSTPQTNIISDIQNCNLPNVSYVTPPGLSSDHAGSLSSSGPGWVGTVYLAVVESALASNPKCQYYGTTAMLITWDDSGGWYDHVTPPVVGGVQWGFRVPLIVASAWASHGASGGLPFVSHKQRDFGSILKFIEGNWNLGSLGVDDASADNLSDMFNYAQAPVAPIAATKMRSMISATKFNLSAAKNDHTPVDNDR